MIKILINYLYLIEKIAVKKKSFEFIITFLASNDFSSKSIKMSVGNEVED